MIQNLQQISVGYWLVAIIAILAISLVGLWLRRNYRAGKIKVKVGVIEAELDRKPEMPKPPQSPPSTITVPQTISFTQPSTISPSPQIESLHRSVQASPSSRSEVEYDVFITCAMGDERWVINELLPSLEQAELKIYLDFRDRPAGMPKPTAQERAIQISRKTLLILSPAFVKDQWRDFESILLQSQDPTNLQLRLIPLLKEACDLPLRLSMLIPVDFTDPERQQIAWSQLWRALGKPNNSSGN